MGLAKRRWSAGPQPIQLSACTGVLPQRQVELRQAFPLGGKFLTAAFHRSMVRVSVPGVLNRPARLAGRRAPTHPCHFSMRGLSLDCILRSCATRECVSGQYDAL